jgi:cold shock protein
MNGRITRIPVETSTGRRKGFGFITPVDGGGDVFFHATSVSGVNFASLKEGDAVEFDVEPSDRGLRAKDVVVK